MSPFGITGYSTSGKTPINYGLKAGQFRMPKYSVFQNKTVINNNIFAGGYGGFNYDYYDNSCCNNSMPGWTKWLMGLGGATTLLGGILNLFAPQKSELGGTDPKTEQPAADEFAGLKEKYPNGEFIKITDNRYNAVVDGKEYDGSSIAELYDNIQNGRTTTSAENPADHTEKEHPESVIGKSDFSTLKDVIGAFDDMLGSKADITGTAKYSWEQADGKDDKSKAPLKITIKTDGKEYVFEKQTGTGDKITYKATTVIANGTSHPVKNNQIYELDLASGKLIQNSSNSDGDSGLGTTIQYEK